MSLRSILGFAALVGIALGVHVFFGWMWTVLAGLAAGMLARRWGWLAGALLVGLDYVILVVYNYVVDARPVSVMTETMGALLGNMPSSVIVALTLCIGLVIGVLSGAAGSQLRVLLDHREREAQPVS